MGSLFAATGSEIEELDQLAVGKGMAHVDPPASRLQLLLLERDGGPRDQRLELSPPPASRWPRPPVDVRGQDAWLEGLVEVARDRLHVGHLRSGGRPAGGSSGRVAGDRPAPLRERPHPVASSQASDSTPLPLEDQVAPDRARGTEHAVAIVAVERDRDTGGRHPVQGRLLHAVREPAVGELRPSPRARESTSQALTSPGTTWSGAPALAATAPAYACSWVSGMSGKWTCTRCGRGRPFAAATAATTPSRARR